MPNMTDEWDAFHSQGFQCMGQLFNLEDVPGDGNCFFHSLAKSPCLSSLLTSNDGREARAVYVDKLSELWQQKPWLRSDIAMVLRMMRPPMEYHNYIRATSPSAHSVRWATDIDMLLVCVALGVKIVSFHNHTSGMGTYNAAEFLPPSLKAELQTRLQGSDHVIFVYNHLYTRPLTPHVRYTFAMCGVNPFVEGDAQPKFKKHLDSLSRERAYGVLLRCNTPLPLDLTIKQEEEK
jgi:hypothetical protein